jgi:hypothetical protein
VIGCIEKKKLKTFGFFAVSAHRKNKKKNVKKIIKNVNLPTAHHQP